MPYLGNLICKIIIFIRKDFKEAVPFYPYDDKIEKTWGNYYSAINRWLTIRDVDANQLNCYQSFINTHLALAYYQLSSRWSGVPFYNGTSKRPLYFHTTNR